MWQGIYKKWSPVPLLEDKDLYVEAVHDDWEGFRIWFSAKNKNAGIVTIVKFDPALMYVNSDESYRLSGEDLNSTHVFWKVEDSQLLKEFHRQSVGVYDFLKIEHYAFLSANDCIDVLSAFEPTFETRIEKSDELLEDKLPKR